MRVYTIRDVQEAAEKLRRESVWWGATLSDQITAIADEVTELKEAFEGGERRERVEEELADVVIACATFCELAGFDMTAIISAKLDKLLPEVANG